MKKELEFLNEVKVSLDEYSVEPLTQLERERMKRNMNKSMQKRRVQYRKYMILAACLALLVVASQTSLGKGLWEQVRQVITIGNLKVNEIDPKTLPRSTKIPEEYRGKYFDKDGNELTEYQPEMYDKDGNLTVITSKSDDYEEPEKFQFQDWDEVQKYLSFQAKKVEYIPEGFRFDRIETYAADEQEPTDYLSAYYVNDNGDFFVVYQRRSSPETGYETGAIQLEKVTINGYDAVLSDNRNLDWEADGVLLSISGRGFVGRDELIKVAQSMK